MNHYLYKHCKQRGFHLQLLSGKEKVELPGRTERVEMAFSEVFVNVRSNHFMAQIYLTNYRSVGVVNVGVVREFMVSLVHTCI